MTINKYLLSLVIITYGKLSSAQQEQKIALNQLGFYPNAAKIAVITADVPATSFDIISATTKELVYSGKLSETKQSGNSSIKTKQANFSNLKTPGVYLVRVSGIADSYNFIVQKDVNHPAAAASLKGFYFIRSNTPLLEKYAGKWARPAGHADTEVLVHASAASKQRPEGTIISSPGGWYDAGDYNKYIVNSGISTSTLFSAYEDFPAYFEKLNVNIPESSNKIPDVLDEAIYNLRWMLTMQDPNDGGVYHKCTNAAFDSLNKMPGQTKLPRYVVQKGTAATLNFAAVAAQANRILKRYNKELPGLADSCLVASEKAWKWCKQNPALVYNQNALNSQFTPKITTGDYGDRKLTDEWFWAASELYITTGKGEYLTDIKAGLAASYSIPSWNEVRMLGYYTLTRNKNKLPSGESSFVDTLKNRIIQMADRFVKKVPANAFGTVMGQSKRDFIWGSNAVACNQGIVLINAYKLTEDAKYLNFALTNLDYILGRNATGYSFLTGIGSKPVMNPHHRPSVADGVLEPVPGLLSGGPNPGMQDRVKYDFTEPETAFMDVHASYASNEIAINWNAPMVYLANAIEALQSKITDK